MRNMGRSEKNILSMYGICFFFVCISWGKHAVKNLIKNKIRLIGKNFIFYRLYLLFQFRVCQQFLPNFFTGVNCGGMIASSKPLADGWVRTF